MTTPLSADRQADVIVVGAGPGGSTAATYLAQSGADVLLLEKTAFPREKVCGDGLTPRAVKALVKLGIDVTETGWAKNRGLRIVGGGHRLELPWPDLSAYPDFGLVRTRYDLDAMLARHAEKAGVRLQERTAVTGPVLDEASGRVVGVTGRAVDDAGRKAGGEASYQAPLVIAADGNSSRLSLALGIEKRSNRPLGVAIRTYYSSPRTSDDWLESWLELWDGTPGRSNLLPGYGWIFGVGDGTVNVGLGILNTSKSFQHVDYKDMLRAWLDATPAEWGLRETSRTAPVRGAALPMAFNRKPHYDRGVLLVGDSGGMVNPFNGEGISYAMESGELAAEVVADALSRTTPAGRERALRRYPSELDARYGGYYTLGRIFVKAIGSAEFMRLATRHGLPRQTLMRFALKLMANLTDPTDGDAGDRLINGLSRLAPAA